MTTTCDISINYEPLEVNFFNSLNTRFASWHNFKCHLALRLFQTCKNALCPFKNSHITKIRVVAFSVMQQTIVIVYFVQWPFRFLRLTLYFNNTRVASIRSVKGIRKEIKHKLQTNYLYWPSKHSPSFTTNFWQSS